MKILRQLFKQIWYLVPASLRNNLREQLNAQLYQPLDAARTVNAGNLLIVGLYGFATGLGEIARQFTVAFQAGKVPTHQANFCRFPGLKEDFDGGVLRPTDAGADGFALVCINPDLMNLAMLASGVRGSHRRVAACWFWELETLPPDWAVMMDAVDEIWAPTQFIAEACRRASPEKPIHVVRPPIDIPALMAPPVDYTDPLPEFAGRTLVYFAYDMRSNHARKNPEAVIAAFKQAVSNNPEPILIIKVKGEKIWPEGLQRLRKAAAQHPQIHIMARTFTAKEMAAVIHRVDILMSLHRSEGLGLILIEAMAAGKPVIATNWSGNQDFMTPDCSVLVDYQLVPIVDPQHFYDKNEGRWAEADVAQAARELKILLENPVARQQLGASGQRHIQNYFDREQWLKTLPESFWQSIK